jgi:nitrile hydratase subunit beta
MPAEFETLFQPGDPVLVRDVFSGHEHVRTPNYVRGVEGRIAFLLGRYRDPTALSKGEADAPFRLLYRVHFPSSAVRGFEVCSGHTITVDIYDNWLERPSNG